MATNRRWTAVPAARSSAPILKIRLYLVLGSLVVSAVMGLFAGISSLTRTDPVIPEPPAVAQGQGFAEIVADDWLAGRGTTVPAGDTLDRRLGASPTVDEDTEKVTFHALEGITRIAWSGFDVYVQEGRTFEAHRFYVGGRVPRELTVVVELTDAGPLLAATPALAPLAAQAEPPRQFDWAESEARTPVSADVERVAAEWAAAYATDDRQALRDLTGDTQRRIYAGLGGFEVVETTMGGAVPIFESTDLVVRVKVTMKDDTGFQATSDWDLRVAAADTAAPRVVAWGPAATGGYLAPYANALNGDPEVTTTTVADGS